MHCGDSPTPYPSDCELTENLRKRAMENAKKLTVAETVLAKARNTRLVLLDVDGVLTDGTLIFSHDGHESKGFNTQDGFGIRLLQEAGVEVGVITARKSEAVSKRCENLKMRYVYQDAGNKLVAYNDILGKSGLKPVDICYMGDDWLDLVLLKRVGFAVVPANGVDEVKDIAHYVCTRNGGRGAVRELCDLILQSKNLLQQYLQQYMNR